MRSLQQIASVWTVYISCLNVYQLATKVTKRQERDSNEYRETDMTIKKEIMIVERHELTTKGCKKANR